MEQIKRYKGTLTLEQMITARNKTISNAKDLYEDANILYNHERLARAYYLLCIANEELGKSIMITSSIVDLVAEDIDWQKFWKRLRNHKDKTRVIEHMENILVSSDENFTAIEIIQDMIPTFEEVKMISLYSDMIQNDFYEPREIIQKNMVESYLKLTGNRIIFFTEKTISEDALRNIKKEDIIKHRNEFKKRFTKDKSRYSTFEGC